jgi:hypothetical protein
LSFGLGVSASGIPPGHASHTQAAAIFYAGEEP